MNQEKIGKFIASLRKEKHLTQEDLAHKLGVSINAVSKWERGICLMDISLLKPICDILDINLNELLSGERIDDDDYQNKSEENILSMFNSLKKLKKSKKILSIILLIIILIISLLIIYKVGFNYGKNVQLFNAEVHFNKEINKNCTGEYQEYYQKNNQKIYLYCLNKLSINNNISLNNYIDKMGIDTLIKKIPNIKKYILFDGGTEEYHNEEITIIKCNTLEGNHDIYIGPSDMNMLKAYNNGVCGKEKINGTFTRTYEVIDITKGEEEDSYYVTLAVYQGQKETVQINLKEKLKVNKNYEFTFQDSLYNINDDFITDIFNSAKLINIKETDRVGMDQIQDPIV